MIDNINNITSRLLLLIPYSTAEYSTPILYRPYHNMSSKSCFDDFLTTPLDWPYKPCNVLDQKNQIAHTSGSRIACNVEGINLTRKDYYFCWTELFRLGKLKRDASDKVSKIYEP